MGSESRDRLVTMGEAAARLGCHRKTLERSIGLYRSLGLVDVHPSAQSRRVVESTVDTCIRNMAAARRRELGVEV